MSPQQQSTNTAEAEANLQLHSIIADTRESSLGMKHVPL